MKTFKYLLIISIVFFTKSSLSSSSSIRKTINKNIFDEISILPDIIEFMKNNVNTDIFLFDMLLNETCSESFLEYIKNNDSISKGIAYSGKGYNDIGSKSECIKRNLTYIYFEIFTNQSKFENGSIFNDLCAFTNKSSYYLGFCTFNNCEKLHRNYINRTINEKLFKFIDQFGISNISIIRYEDIRSNKKTDDSVESQHNLDIIFKILSLLVFGLFVLKNIITFIGNIYYSYFIEDDLNDDFNESEMDNYTKTNEHLSNMERILPDIEPQRQNNVNPKGKLYTIFKLISFKKDLIRLFGLKNRYYNDTDLQVLNGIKSLLVFLMIFNENFFTLLIIPNRFIGSLEFYKSILMIIIKYSVFSYECYVSLNAFQFIFKLMSHIKKKGNTSFKTFCEFYFHILTRAIIFYFIFFYFHFFLKNLLTDNGFFYKYLNDLDQTTCISHPWTIMVPFYYQYKCNNSFTEYTSCYLIFNMIMSEFYCMTFVIVLFFFAFKIKSQKFDYSVIIILMMSGPLSILSFLDIFKESNMKLNFWIFMGESYGLSKPHILIFTYFIGVFLGLSYFYYCDVVSENNFQENRNYIPFKLCYIYMKFLDQISKTSHFLLLCLSIMIQMSMSASFTILINYQKTLNMDLSFWLKILFIYEKRLFIIGFMLMIIILIICNKSETLNYFFSANFFIFFSRLSFCIICLTKSMLYLFYTINYSQVFINHTNLYFNTFGLLFFMIILSIPLVSLLELPFRILYKKFIRKAKNNIKSC